MAFKVLLIGIMLMLSGCDNLITSEYIDETIETCKNRGGIESMRGGVVLDAYIIIKCKDSSYKKLDFSE